MRLLEDQRIGLLEGGEAYTADFVDTRLHYMQGEVSMPGRKAKPHTRRRYSPEFKMEAVRLLQSARHGSGTLSACP